MADPVQPPLGGGEPIPPLSLKPSHPEARAGELYAVLDERAMRNATLAPQCPPVGTNFTNWLVRRRRIRYQRRQTYHYHHAP